jgi:hypothetical protein
MVDLCNDLKNDGTIKKMIEQCSKMTDRIS